MITYFSDNTYSTPPDVKRHILDVLMFGKRWGLYGAFLFLVLKARRASLDGIYDDELWAHSSHRVFDLVERCGGRFQIEGFEHLRAVKPPVVFVANHMSTLETQVLPAMIAPLIPVTFVVKEKLVTGKLFGPIMRSRDPITVGRKHPGKDLIRVLEGSAERLKKGISLVIFPQSTRFANFSRDEFNSLGAKVAQRNNVSVVPVALKTDFWENGSLFHGFGPIRKHRTIRFAFGAPIPPETGAKETHSRTVDFIESRLSSWAQPDKENT